MDENYLQGKWKTVALLPQGNAGIGLSILIILCTVSVALISVLSAIGMCERLRIGTGDF